MPSICTDIILSNATASPVPFLLLNPNSVQARVVRRGRVFREYVLLPGILPGARGYLGGEDIVRLEDLKAN